MNRQKTVIGSRGSKLALWQAEHIKSLLHREYPDMEFEIRVIKTSGDLIQDTPPAKIGDKGLFTKEIEHALLRKEIDLAVHSMKDLPTALPAELTIGAVLQREDPRDSFVSYKYSAFDQLPENATLATSSLRRRVNILHLRPDINIVDMRGNLDTRLRKLKESDYDGMLLAAAGLLRLGLSERITEIIPAQRMLPAVAQGALAVEIREDDPRMRKLLQPLYHTETFAAVTAERAFLAELEGGCQVPVGALATIEENHLYIEGFISDLNANKYLRKKLHGNSEDAKMIGTGLAQKLIDLGAKTILAEIYGKNT